MNILFINHSDCSPEIAGGVNRVIYAITRSFIKDYGYNCYIGYFKDLRAGKKPAEFSGRIKLSSNFNGNEFRTFLVQNHIQIVEVNFLQKKNLFTLPLIYKITKEVGAKLIYELHEFPGFEVEAYGTFDRVLFSIRNKDKIGVELYRWMITLFRPILRPFADILIRKKYRMPYDNCDKLVLLSQFYQDTFCRIAGITKSEVVKDNRFVAIGNGLPFDDIISDEDILKKQKNVVVVQRMDDFGKRVSLILKMWRLVEHDPRLNDWTLTIVGDGESLNYYRYLDKKLKLQRVTFTGHQYPVEYYRKASVFLMASSIEGWPMVLMEALQNALPLLAFDSFGALHDIIQDEYNGKLLPNNNIDAFYHYLADLLLDDARRVKMAYNAKKSSEQFRLCVFVEKWVQLFEQMIDENKIR